MRKPDNSFIDQFKEKFGDLLLSCDGKIGKGSAPINAEDLMLPVSYAKDTGLFGPMQLDNVNSGQILGQTNNSSISSNTPESFSPAVVSKKQKTSYNCSLPGSGAVFYNKAGDLHSPMIEWNTTLALLLDALIQYDPPTFWGGSGCFTLLAQTQNWLYGEATRQEYPNYTLGFLLQHDSDYTVVDSLDYSGPTKFDLATPEVDLSGDSLYDNGGKYENSQFRYTVTLQAPIAMLRYINEYPVTYLNKGQTYSLKVADSKPPIRDIALVQYRMFVRVSFEEQDQRSDLVVSWQLWKDGRGRNEANKCRSELLADSAGCKGYHQIWLEKTYVDGFCVTWTADPMRKVSECLIPLRFNFLSTDFSRLKGVKGVPVRLCTKTELLRLEGVKRTTEHDSEMCYCAIKLFRDHGAE
ncbi:hypothetical protein N7533_003753 [Penicillium manginii]|uniref:uncharacterized protein n=1 Tax=Penicillium manginii TaxID=203109 RepID=UPI002546D08F|nr:uncharacterized protein N7533_003753 [Penicillium manginii]KAJ5754210.1 hypothetical protein N7533_003753 [Penicillium manginii]